MAPLLHQAAREPLLWEQQTLQTSDLLTQERSSQLLELFSLFCSPPYSRFDEERIKTDLMSEPGGANTVLAWHDATAII